MTETAPYGSWTSPVSAERVMASSARIGQVAVAAPGVADGESLGAIWWSEMRPSEGGRNQLVRRDPDRDPVDVLGDGFSARSMVHEYGGGSWWLAGEALFFVNGADQRIWRIDPGFEPVAITPAPQQSCGLRYADGVVTPDLRWIVCVQEAHPGESGVPADATEPLNRLVAVPATGGTPVVLRANSDFVMSPRLDQVGEVVAWIEWSHPDMPWDSSELWVGRLDADPDGRQVSLVDARCVAGGVGESIVQPEWDPDNRLWFCSDRSDWWNLYHFPTGGPPSGIPVPVAAGNFEVALPAWVFGESRYAFCSDHRVVFAASSDGLDHLAVYDTIERRVDRIPVESTCISQVRVSRSVVVFVGASFTSEPAVITALVGRGGAVSRPSIVSGAPDGGISSALLSAGQPITFPTDGGVAHGIFYPPTNAGFTAPDGERPPLIVMIHGGPTSSAQAALNLRTQFWTSRGFAVIDVNHRGSTGFGRRFRNELRGQWGVVDLADCIAAARFLAEAGRADPDRLLIRGGSAGGYTTLAALTFSDEFAAGCSLYGIADLELLTFDDHKFESRYTESLVAPYPAGIDVYRQRSPIHFLDRMSSPVILFQGTEDTVVPPSQAEVMEKALGERGIPHAAIYFKGEGHGFRQAANIIRCLEAELSFYAQVLGFPHPADVERVQVEHLREHR